VASIVSQRSRDRRTDEHQELRTEAPAADRCLWSNTSNQISSLCSMFEKPKCTATWGKRYEI